MTQPTATPEAAPTTGPTVTNTAGGVLTGVTPAAQPTFTVTTTPNTGTNSTILQTNPTQTFTAEQIAKARQEEKDKLYPQLEELKKTVTELSQERDRKMEAERKKATDAEAALEEARKADTDTRTLLDEQEKRFQAELARRDAESAERDRIFDMERQYQELQTYRSNATVAAADDIVPELLDLVTGTTREEIDASIAGLKERSARIIEQMAAAQQAARAGMRGAPVTAPPAGPLDTYSGHDPVLEAATNGSLSFEDYVKNRDKLLSSAAQLRSRGIYG